MSIDLRTIHKPLNLNLIDMMSKLIEHTERKIKMDTKQKFKLTSFRKALHSIQNCSFEIKTKKQAMELDGIGKGTADRIEEFLNTGTLKEFDEELDANTKLLLELQNVHGIGPANAKKFINDGIKSVEDLQQKVERKEINVIHSISVGLKYYKSFQEKISYKEVEDIYVMIKNIITEKFSDVKMDCCGSHRRLKDFSGDIDILITHFDNNFSKQLPLIIKLLIDKGILIDHLTELGQTKYMGVCVHPDIKIGRRIDIRFIEYNSYNYALLYFTGSVNVNKEMRLIALKKGMTLNEYSLVENYSGKKFIVNNEKEIFDILGIVYLTPKERNL